MRDEHAAAADLRRAVQRVFNEGQSFPAAAVPGSMTATQEGGQRGTVPDAAGVDVEDIAAGLDDDEEEEVRGRF
jgi:hypothetical protein